MMTERLYMSDMREKVIQVTKNAFLELEADIVEKKYILVEDNLAKTIIQKILVAEGLEGLLQVELCPGGASNIKNIYC